MGNQIIGCFNAEVPLVEFERLMRNVDIVLNQDAVRREAYYQDRNGHELEQDVFNVMKDCAAGTPDLCCQQRRKTFGRFHQAA